MNKKILLNDIYKYFCIIKFHYKFIIYKFYYVKIKLKKFIFLYLFFYDYNNLI